MRYLSEIFGRHFWYIGRPFPNNSVSFLSFLLKLHKSSDISSSGWDIFLKFLEDNPGLLVHNFQIILNFLYFCQSVSWLTSLLKSDKCRDIGCSGWDIFLKFLVVYFIMKYCKNLTHMGLFLALCHKSNKALIPWSQRIRRIKQ